MVKSSTIKQLVPIHYIMWAFKAGGAELSVNSYIYHFKSHRKLHAYSLRGLGSDIFEGKDILLGFGKPSNWQCYFAYFQYCCNHRSAIFHLINVGPVILMVTLLAGVRRPIYHIHGTVHWKNDYQKLILKFIWWLCGFFQVKYIANSYYSASVFRNNIIAKKSQVIYNGFPVEQFISSRRRRTNLKNIGYAGRLHHGKNVDIVIRLFEELAASDNQVELWLAGDGALRPSLELMAAKSPYVDRIHFLGFVKDIVAFYASLDLLLFLSAYESFGNVVAEALLTGLPVLTSNIPVFSEIHDAENDFLLGDPQNYEVVRANFLASVAQYDSLAEKAFKISDQIKNKFDINQHLASIQKIYEFC